VLLGKNPYLSYELSAWAKAWTDGRLLPTIGSRKQSTRRPRTGPKAASSGRQCASVAPPVCKTNESPGPIPIPPESIRPVQTHFCAASRSGLQAPPKAGSSAHRDLRGPYTPVQSTFSVLGGPTSAPPDDPPICLRSHFAPGDPPGRRSPVELAFMLGSCLFPNTTAVPAAKPSGCSAGPES